MLSMGLGTFETIGKLFTSALEKDKVHEWKEEIGERERRLGQREGRGQIDKGVRMGKRKERKREEKRKVQGQYGILFSSLQ